MAEDDLERQLETGNSLAEEAHLVSDTNKASNIHSDGFETVSSIEELREAIADDVVQSRPFQTFVSPFEAPQGSFNPTGERFLRVPLVYCDQTASNRPLKSIESYMEKVCLPLYGNTHTNTSITGSQSTAFVSEARQIIAEETNAKITGKASLDVVLFAGNGATSAVDLLVDCLGIRFIGDDSKRPVVFIGPYEHHSNIIPWRESGCDIVMVPESEDFDVDFDALENLLQKIEYSGRVKMGTFSAASNVTGKVADVDRIADILHRHGALAFFDYATASSYLSINMNPLPSDKDPSPALVAKDAVFISPHKMLGGSGGTPGILIVKKNLVNQFNAPKRAGGGTVFYVTSTDHRFLSNRIERFEGGSPNVTGIIRAGLTFLMKRKIDKKFARLAQSPIRSIQDCDYEMYKFATDYLQTHAKNIVLLGREGSRERLPILSFLVRFQDRFLHYNFVCAVLNDLFGIQSRGGCQCAGPYSQRLLGLTETKDGSEIPTQANRSIEEALLTLKGNAELFRPGYTRLCLPYKGLRTAEVQYVLKALAWVSEFGWALMCQYRFSHKTGEWRHHTRQGRPLGSTRRWLSHLLSAQDGNASSVTAQGDAKQFLDKAFNNASLVLKAAIHDQSNIAQAFKSSGAQSVEEGANDLESLRWFAYPKECEVLLKSSSLQFDVKDLVGPVNPLGQVSVSRAGIAAADKRGTVCLRPVGGQDRSNDEPDQNGLTHSTTASGQSKATKKSLREKSSWGKGAPSVNTNPEVQQQSVDRASDALSKTKKFKHIKPPAKLMRLINQAVIQWQMLENGDRLLLGLSGGKDSLSLLHCLLELKRKSPINFELEVCTVDPMTDSFDPSPLIGYVESLGLKYHYIRDEIVSRAQSAGKDGKIVSSLCAYCARMKRGNLYRCARDNGCNKLVLAQHLDDCAESLLMSIMHNGMLRTMKANYKIDAGDISVIRPLVYCRESLTTEFAKTAKLPVINENCPACFEEPKERARIKKLLSREEALYPNFYDNIRRSIIPLMHDDLTLILRAYTEEVVARSRKVPFSRKRKLEDHQESSENRSNGVSESVNGQQILLHDASEDQLLRELTRRKALRNDSITQNSSKSIGDSGNGAAMCTVEGGCTIFE